MSASVLTAIMVDKAKAGAIRREIVDALVPGLRLVVQPSGAKSWAVRYSFAGKPAKKTLGQFPHLPLSDAREAARSVLHVLGKGNDPARTDTPGGSLEDAVSLYRRLHVDKKLRSGTRRYVERELSAALKAWTGRRLEDVRRRDVIAFVDEAAERGATVGNCALAVVSAFFAWCLSRDLIEASPATGIRKSSKPPTRERVLDDAELVAVWRAAEASPRYSAFFKLLILTGCRRDEIAKLEPGEIADDVITLAPARTKTKSTYVIPITPLMRAVLDGLPKTNARYVLTGTDKPVPGNDEPKRAIKAPVMNWRLHDLRRTFATNLARLGVAPHVIEACLHHKPQGLVSVYQRHTYEAEARAAAELWSRHVELLTKPFAAAM